MGIALLALGSDGAAIRFSRADARRGPGAMVHGKEIVEARHRSRLFDPGAFAEYVRCFNWKTIKGSCADYRACPTCDFDMDKADFEAGRKITVPLLVIWGARSHTEGVHGDVLQVWQRGYATNVSGGALACGHYVPEEAPGETLRWLLQHFS
jgi:haloacetate dehalogenase